MTQQQFFEQVIRSLETLGIPYMVTGSVAAMLYGEPRLTNDMDVVLALAPRHVDPLIRAFSSDAYYTPPREAILDAIRHRGQFNIIHVGSGSRADLILRKDSEFASEEFSRRQPMPFAAGLDSQSATPEDVILAKLMYYRSAHSEKHLTDIAGMLRVVGATLDFGYLQSWVGRLGCDREWAMAQERETS